LLKKILGLTFLIIITIFVIAHESKIHLKNYDVIYIVQRFEMPRNLDFCGYELNHFEVQDGF